jgi:anti-sigma B factor antagonist
MDFSQTLQGDVAVIACAGPVVAGACGELHTAAVAAIEKTGKVVLDLAGVPYIDSTGLGMLAFLCVSARRRSGDLKLAGANAQVRDVLETTMLGRVFDMHPTADAARAAFASVASARR